MANQPYLSDASQASAQIVATLGAANLATLTDGQLTAVPALSSDQTNWYFNFIDPGYADYYDWTPSADGSGTGAPTDGGNPGPTPVVSALPAPVCATPPSGAASGSSGAAAPAPAGRGNAGHVEWRCGLRGRSCLRAGFAGDGGDQRARCDELARCGRSSCFAGRTCLGQCGNEFRAAAASAGEFVASAAASDRSCHAERAAARDRAAVGGRGSAGPERARSPECRFDADAACRRGSRSIDCPSRHRRPSERPWRPTRS